MSQGLVPQLMSAPAAYEIIGIRGGAPPAHTVPSEFPAAVLSYICNWADSSNGC